MRSDVVEMGGKRFGSLVVLRHAGSSPRGGATWLCHCDCGSQAVIRGSDIRRGNTRSCGCRQGKSAKTYQDLRGKRFGTLTVVGSLGRSGWFCHCDCGKAIQISAAELRRGERQSCSHPATHGMSKTPEYRTWVSLRKRSRRSLRTWARARRHGTRSTGSTTTAITNLAIVGGRRRASSPTTAGSGRAFGGLKVSS
jgi:hypothetical protein